MVCQGTEVYGIGTIEKLYAQGLPGLSFLCMSEGPLVAWLRAGGHRVEVIPGLTSFMARSSLGTLARLPAAFRRARRSARRIHEAIRGRGVRIIHTHWLPQRLIAGYLRPMGYRIVWQINDNMDRRRMLGLGVKLNHRLARWGADLLLPASDYVAGYWAGCGVPMRTIRNAAVPVFDGPSAIPESPVACLTAGRMVPSKGHHLAVEAVLRARREGLDVRLDCFGGPLEDNEYAEAIAERIQEEGAGKFIRLCGFASDLRQRHQQYHLGLQCRIDPEPCSLWVCEAMVDGLPLLAADNGGTPELVADGLTGFLFASGDVDEMSRKLIALCRDPRRLRAMRSAAFERGRERFQLGRFIEQTMSAYAAIA